MHQQNIPTSNQEPRAMEWTTKSKGTINATYEYLIRIHLTSPTRFFMNQTKYQKCTITRTFHVLFDSASLSLTLLLLLLLLVLLSILNSPITCILFRSLSLFLTWDIFHILVSFLVPIMPRKFNQNMYIHSTSMAENSKINQHRFGAFHLLQSIIHKGNFRTLHSLIWCTCTCTHCNFMWTVRLLHACN